MSDKKIISVLVADDHILLGQAVAYALSIENDLEVTIVHSGAEVIDIIVRDGFKDIILLDIQMPGVKTVEKFVEIAKANVGGKTVIMSSTVNSDFVKCTIELGGFGYIPKTTHLKSIPSILRMIASGQSFIPFNNRVEMPDNKILDTLSDKEMLVLSRVAEGATNKAVANALNITETIVKMHMRAITRKLSVRTRTEAALLFQKKNIP
jgi:two-component system nitrate/nitrite response regulator NarP